MLHQLHSIERCHHRLFFLPRLKSLISFNCGFLLFIWRWLHRLRCQFFFSLIFFHRAKMNVNATKISRRNLVRYDRFIANWQSCRLTHSLVNISKTLCAYTVFFFLKWEFRIWIKTMWTSYYTFKLSHRTSTDSISFAPSQVTIRNECFKTSSLKSVVHPEYSFGHMQFFNLHIFYLELLSKHKVWKKI